MVLMPPISRKTELKTLILRQLFSITFSLTLCLTLWIQWHYIQETNTFGIPILQYK